MPGDCFYLHFSGALEVDSFGSLLEVHIFIYILWSNLCIWVINTLLSAARIVNYLKLTLLAALMESCMRGLLYVDLCGLCLAMNSLLAFPETNLLHVCFFFSTNSLAVSPVLNCQSFAK